MPESNAARADKRLAQDVLDALNETEPMEAVGFRITVTAQDGVVQLAGVVRTEVHRYLAGQNAAKVRRVERVDNHLLSDQTVAADVARAVTADVGLAKLSLLVESNLGTVVMRGPLTDPAMIDHAIERAAAVDGVVSASFAHSQY